MGPPALNPPAQPRRPRQGYGRRRGNGGAGPEQRQVKATTCHRKGIHPLSYDVRNFLYLSLTILVCFLVCLCYRGSQSHQGNDDQSIPLSDSFFFLCLQVTLAMRPQAFSTATSSSSATTVRGLEAPLRYGSPSVRASAMINLSLLSISLTLLFIGDDKSIPFTNSSFFNASELFPHLV